MPVKKSDKVTEKSTKVELWEAYNSLLEEATQETLTFSVPKNENKLPDSLKKLSELKISLSQTIDKLSEQMMAGIEEENIFKQEFAKQKQTIIELLNTKKEALEKEIEKVRIEQATKKVEFDSEQDEQVKRLKIERQQEEEEYRYNLKIKRRNEVDEYEQKRKKREEDLAKKEQDFAAKSADYDHLRQEVENFPNLIATKVREAEVAIAKDLNQKHDQEIKSLILAKDNELKISEIKNINLEEKIKNQASEIIDLKKQVVELTKQLKDMATSAIESRAMSQPVAKQDI